MKNIPWCALTITAMLPKTKTEVTAWRIAQRVSLENRLDAYKKLVNFYEASGKGQRRSCAKAEG